MLAIGIQGEVPKDKDYCLNKYKQFEYKIQEASPLGEIIRTTHRRTSCR